MRFNQSCSDRIASKLPSDLLWFPQQIQPWFKQSVSHPQAHLHLFQKVKMKTQDSIFNTEFLPIDKCVHVLYCTVDVLNAWWRLLLLLFLRQHSVAFSFFFTFL
ncbi:hypothetical protein CRENBAI_007907 [Crenichthys baileyi]|uniref:Uncharacterized protein n=1 Tax=Crenichthys baileyi TaxID=28760 RepID=A0AAV9S7J5_9TELE